MLVCCRPWSVLSNFEICRSPFRVQWLLATPQPLIPQLICRLVVMSVWQYSWAAFGAISLVGDPAIFQCPAFLVLNKYFLVQIFSIKSSPLQETTA
jgi:hypothetical protein